MLLNELKRSSWLNKKSKRVGRGNGSGKGNYSTKGLKGQWARSGGGMPAWFEGWQTPLTQRLPKLRWFKKFFKHINDFQVVNLSSLEKDERISAWTTIDKALLKQLKYISNAEWTVKLLGNGELSKKLSFVGIDAFSGAAKEKIEKAWGEIK